MAGSITEQEAEAAYRKLDVGLQNKPLSEVVGQLYRRRRLIRLASGLLAATYAAAPEVLRLPGLEHVYELPDHPRVRQIRILYLASNPLMADKPSMSWSRVVSSEDHDTTWKGLEIKAGGGRILASCDYYEAEEPELLPGGNGWLFPVERGDDYRRVRDEIRAIGRILAQPLMPLQVVSASGEAHSSLQ